MTIRSRVFETAGVLLLALCWLACNDDGANQMTASPVVTQPTQPQPMQPTPPMQMQPAQMQPQMPSTNPTPMQPAMDPAPEPMSPQPAGTMAPEPMAGAGGMAAETPVDPPATGGAILPPVDSTQEDGPFESMTDTSGPHHVWRPAELGQDGLKHPIFVWGTGAGATPERYNDFFYRFATHGFVVVAPTPASLSASNMSAALEWILEQNDSMSSPYYQKLDPERIAMGGHSQGSVATFDVEGREDRLKTTIHIAGGSFSGTGSSNVKTPTAYICGETDFALPNCERDFENVQDQPTFFSVLQGVDHVMCAREALPGMIAWLRWHLGDETERAAQFGEGGEFQMGIWSSQTKNWSY